MKNTMIILIMTFIHICGKSQLVLERSVISPFACNVQSQGMISSTAGQIAGATIAGADNIITQGFEQPTGYQPLEVTLTFSFNACTQTYDAKVTQVSSCEPNQILTYTWNGVEGTSEAHNLPALVNVFITASGGCTFSGNYNLQQMEVINLPCILNFPNFISPNDDGNNDDWKISNITYAEYANNKISIFNRWGALVWRGERYDNSTVVWAGQNSKGEKLPDGTYYYVAVIAGTEYTGYIELSR